MKDVPSNASLVSPSSKNSLGARLVPWLFLELLGVQALAVWATFWWPSLEPQSSWAVVRRLASTITGVFLGQAIPAWMFAPVGNVARQRRLPPQFMLVDLGCLFVLIQACAAVAYLGTTSHPTVRWWLTVFAWVLCLMIWAGGVRTLSRAGIVHWRHRTVFLLLTVPITMVSVVVQFIALIGAQSGGPLAGSKPFLLFVGTMGCAGLLLCAYGVRRATRRMLALSSSGDEARGDLETPLPPGHIHK